MKTSFNVNQLTPDKRHETAVVLHLYYTELFDEVKSYLDNLGGAFDLYISLPEDKATFEPSIREQYPDAAILLVPNRGRDLAPFLELLKIILPLGYETLLKVHTKKTLHREDGTTWRKDVYEKLLGSPELVAAVKKAFLGDPKLGILGPKEHVLDSRFYMGGNKEIIEDLVKRFGMDSNTSLAFPFVASTMFWARTEVFKPLLEIYFETDEFPAEPLPTDATLAHSLERFFGLLAVEQGFTIKAIDRDGTISEPEPFAIYQYAPVPKALALREVRSIVYYPAYKEAYAIEYLRILAPFHAAGIELVNGSPSGEPDPERVLLGDAVIFQREFPRNLTIYEQIISIARQNNKLIFYELDDLLFDLPDKHPERIRQSYVSALMPMLASITEADLLIVPTLTLKDTLIGFNSNVIILPNYLDDKIWQLKEPKVSYDFPLTIGYVGSYSHTPDLEIIAPVVKKLLNDNNDRLRFVVIGTPLPSSLIDVPNIVYQDSPTDEYLKFAPIFQEMKFDIFIAPLEENMFNRCKSPIKFLEYSALGVPGVYSAIDPYNGMITDGVDGFLASNEMEWFDKLTLLIEKPELRQQMAIAAQKTVREKWLLSQNIRSWEDIYNKLNHEFLLEDPPKSLRAYITNTINRQLYYDRVDADARYQNLMIEARQISEQNANLSDQIRIYNSREWQAVLAYQQIRNKLSKVVRKFKYPSGSVSRLFPSRVKNDKDLLLGSGLFDTEYYLRQNPDVRNVGVDPVIHYLEFGGTEGRNPSPKFDGKWYLNRYPDVKNAKINPLLHYLRYGKQEGRTIQAVGETQAAEKNSESKMTLSSFRNEIPEKILLSSELKVLLGEHMLSTYKIALSHDDYLNVTGGAQVIIADEQHQANQSELTYLHIYPYKKIETLANENILLYLGLNLDGKELGDTEAGELLAALRALENKHLAQISIHHSMGFNLRTLQALLDLAGKQGVFWLHDYFSLCPSYNLLRNDIEYCGAPDINSNACRLCHYGNARAVQAAVFERLFKENKLEVASPSHFTYELWQSRFPVVAPVRVVPPAILKWKSNSPVRYKGGTLRVAFLGYPLDYKGWPTWLRLVNRFTGNKNYKFFHFSTQQGEQGNYSRIEVRVTKENRMAMVESLRWNLIDVAVLWSTVPETFSFTLHEALAAGCFILTNLKSGNIQDYIRHNPECGLILEDEEALIELFESGTIVEKVEQYQKNGKPQADLVFGTFQETEV